MRDKAELSIAFGVIALAFGPWMATMWATSEQTPHGSSPVLRFGIKCIFWVCVITAAAWAIAARADASPLSLSAHQANLYGGKLATARVCVNLQIQHPQVATLTAAGQQRTDAEGGPITGDDGWKIPTMIFRLKPGHRRFCRHFDVEHLYFDTVPDRPGLPRSRWNTYDPERFNVVHAVLTLGPTDKPGIRYFERSVQISPTFPALFPPDCFRRRLC